MSPPLKPVKSSKSRRKPLETGTCSERLIPSEPHQISDAMISTAYSAMEKANQLPSMGESAATSKKKTSKGKPTTSEVSTQTQSSSKISEADLTSREKGFLPFWDKFCQEISEKLWSATKTDLQGSVLTSSDGYVSNKIANSWFSVVATCLQTEKWLKISLPSSMFSVADSTDLVNTNLLSKKIRVYPETLLAKKWRTWSSASRWCYNQAIAILKTERIGKYELRKRIMDTAPKWVSEQPYNPRQLAIFQALEAHKAACKSQGVAKFRSCKDNSQTIRFQKDNWKSNTFYPRETFMFVFSCCGTYFRGNATRANPQPD
jgi:putative transposase